MANEKTIKYILNSIRKNQGSETTPSFGMPTPTVNPLTGLQAQTANAETRLNAVGVNTKPIVDKRNWFEKWANLPQDQNAFFDIFELLNRGQQAIFGGIINAQEGEDVWQGVTEGFSGEERNNSGGKILRNMFEGGRDEGDWTDWTHWVGSAIDIVFDPADLGLALATGGGSLAVKAGAEAVDTAVDGARMLDKIVDGVKVVDKAVDQAKIVASVAKVTDNVGLGTKIKNYAKADLIPTQKLSKISDPFDYLQKAFFTSKKELAKQGIEKLSLSDIVMRPFLAGGKFGFHSMDSFIEFSLKYGDEMSLVGRGVDEFGKPIATMVDKYRKMKTNIVEGMKKTGSAMNRVIQDAGDRWNRVVESFDVDVKSFNNQVKEMMADPSINMDYNNLAQRTFFQEQMMMVYEANNLSRISMGWNELLDSLANSKFKAIPYDADNYLKIKRRLKAFDIEIDDVVKVRKLGDEWTIMEFDKDFATPEKVRTLRVHADVTGTGEMKKVNGKVLMEKNLHTDYDLLPLDEKLKAVRMEMPQNKKFNVESKTAFEQRNPFSVADSNLARKPQLNTEQANKASSKLSDLRYGSKVDFEPHHLQIPEEVLKKGATGSPLTLEEAEHLFPENPELAVQATRKLEKKALPSDEEISALLTGDEHLNYTLMELTNDNQGIRELLASKGLIEAKTAEELQVLDKIAERSKGVTKLSATYGELKTVFPSMTEAEYSDLVKVIRESDGTVTDASDIIQDYIKAHDIPYQDTRLVDHVKLDQDSKSKFFDRKAKNSTKPEMSGIRHTEDVSANASPLLDDVHYEEFTFDEKKIESAKVELRKQQAKVKRGKAKAQTITQQKTAEMGNTLELDATWVKENIAGGHNGEHLNMANAGDVHRNERLTESIKKHGYRQSEPINIWVDANGDAWIAEGNHRLESAIASGSPVYATVEYFDGGERVYEKAFNPDNLVDSVKSSFDSSLAYKNGGDYVVDRAGTFKDASNVVPMKRSEAVAKTQEVLKNLNEGYKTEYTKKIDELYETIEAPKGDKAMPKEQFIEKMRQDPSYTALDTVNLETENFVDFQTSMNANLNNIPEEFRKRYKETLGQSEKIWRFGGMTEDVPVKYFDMTAEERIKWLSEHGEENVKIANKAVGAGTDPKLRVEDPTKKLKKKKIGQLVDWEEGEAESLRTYLGGLSWKNKRKIDPIQKQAFHFFGADDTETVAKRFNKVMDEQMTGMLTATTGRLKFKTIEDVVNNSELTNAYVTLRRLDTQLGTEYSKMGAFADVDALIRGDGTSQIARAMDKATATKKGFYDTLRSTLIDDVTNAKGTDRLVQRTTRAKEFLALKKDMFNAQQMSASIRGLDAVSQGYKIVPNTSAGVKWYNGKTDYEQMASEIRTLPIDLQKEYHSIVGGVGGDVAKDSMRLTLGNFSMDMNMKLYNDEFQMVQAFLTKSGNEKMADTFRVAVKKALVDEDYTELGEIIQKVRQTVGFEYTNGIALDRLAEKIDKAMPDHIDRIMNRRIQQMANKKAVTLGTVNKQIFDVEDTKFEIGRFYTKEQRAQIEELMKNPVYQKAVAVMDSTIKGIQKTIGELEFDNARALTRSTMKNYAPHALTPEMKAYQSSDSIMKQVRETLTKQGKYDTDMMDVSLFIPGKTSYNKARKYQMSALEANNVVKEYYKTALADDVWFKENVPEELTDAVKKYFEADLFATDAQSSVAEFMTTKYNAINKNHKNTNVLLTMAFGDPKNKSGNAMIKKVNKNEGLQKGWTKLNPDEAVKINSMLKDTLSYTTGKEARKQIMDLKKLINTAMDRGSDAIHLEDHLYKALQITANKSGADLMDALASMTGVYKKFKTLSPAFNMRNVMGNATNMWISGMPLTDIYSSMKTSMDYIHAYKGIKAKIAQGGMEALSGEESKVFAYYNEFLQNGFFSRGNATRLFDMEAEVRKATQDKLVGSLSPDKKVLGKTKQVVDKATGAVLKGNMALNVTVDQHARMALFIYAKDHPEFVQKLGVDNAMDAVRLVLFDPNDLTFFEQDVMKKLVPFYTFARQNLAFQAKNVVKNSKKYYQAWKAYRELWDISGADMDGAQDYEKNQMYLPIPFMSGDGKYVAMKANLPMSDLFEFADDPLKRVVNAMTPFIKAPIEAVSGTNTLTGRPIEAYEGERSTSMPYMTKKQEWALGNTGLDVPLRAVTTMLRGKDATGGMLYNGSDEKNALSREYDKLNRLEDAMKRYKATHKEGLPTLADLKGTTKQKTISSELQSISEILNKYR